MTDITQYRYASFQYGKDSYFSGVVLVIPSRDIEKTDTYIDNADDKYCRIINVFRASMAEWVPGWKFTLEEDVLFETVTKEQNPEYFL